MHINVERKSQILDFFKFNDFFPVLCSNLCFPIEKIAKAKFPLEAHSWVNSLFFSTLKILAKETTHFDVQSAMTLDSFAYTTQCSAATLPS